MISFAIVESDGTTASVDPRLDAYRYAARLQSQGRHTSILIEGSKFEVASPGLLTIKFVPITWRKDV